MGSLREKEIMYITQLKLSHQMSVPQVYFIEQVAVVRYCCVLI